MKKPKKSMNELTKNFEQYSKDKELNKNNKELFDKGVKKLADKTSNPKEKRK